MSASAMVHGPVSSNAYIDKVPTDPAGDPSRRAAHTGPSPVVEKLAQAMKEKLGQEYDLTVLPNADTVTYDAFTQAKITADSESLFVFDLAVTFRRWCTWQALMPRVTPFYAAKCNMSPALLSLLAALGSGFCCGSASELSLVLGLGIDATKRIIFANPCKLPSHITKAEVLGVDLTAFDTVGELHKVAKLHPTMRLVLRIRADDPTARCQLGNKFGAELETVPELMRAANELGLKVIGCAFHVGIRATDPQAFIRCLDNARYVFEEGRKQGFDMTLLDIGGGFTGGDPSGEQGLSPVAMVINEALAKHFPDPRVRVIAEPGRFFAEASATLATLVYGERVIVPGKEVDYWVTDGLYGNMNSVMYDHATMKAHPLRLREEDGMVVANVYGPTCNGKDQILSREVITKLEVGDWLVFEEMGAYTMTGARDRGGFAGARAPIYYVWTDTYP
eukprot:NODE_1296_length_1793_cov_56.582036_g1231_i0.p1 GENE.NODE_1296_length_1793_cov_56.582036_g1231_i0~~NODE_1296_length_1793_cov_56.582036_g1231_i0.p1  ORF type:complete len:463 (+),score=122.79 NODE_1296_length_1793_cov_56.582036_g1231_i0:44-1390(+)